MRRTLLRDRFGSLAGRGVALQWFVLLVVSGVLVLVLEAVQLPAALLLGPMLAGIFIAAIGTSLRLPRWPQLAAQAVVGCLIARSFTPSLVGAIFKDWPLFLVAICGVIVASCSLGWLLARLRALPGTAAVWGSFPGAATAMILMAEAYGADVRLVAFMQYLRVVFVSLAASLVARIWTTPGTGPVAASPWFPPVSWLPFIETLALVALGAIVAPLLRIPAGPMLLPLVGGALLEATGTMTIELPPWLLAVSYAFIGWSIGLRFTRPILQHVVQLLPRVAASILTLIVICGGFAFLLNRVAGVDPLTAYLATSPGGADSVAIIAASSNVDLPFVMALQSSRFLVVLLIGPALARFIAGRIRA
jgi:membrane AbrB-like protein